MAYTIEGLDAQEKSTLISEINERIQDLEFDQEGEQRDKESYEDKSDSWRQDLESTTTAYDSITAAIDVLEDGPVKTKLLKEQKRLGRRKEDLEERSENYSAMALIEKELEVNLLVAQVGELTSLKTQLETPLAEG